MGKRTASAFMAENLAEANENGLKNPKQHCLRRAKQSMPYSCLSAHSIK